MERQAGHGEQIVDAGVCLYQYINEWGGWSWHQRQPGFGEEPHLTITSSDNAHRVRRAGAQWSNSAIWPNSKFCCLVTISWIWGTFVAAVISAFFRQNSAIISQKSYTSSAYKKLDKLSTSVHKISTLRQVQEHKNKLGSNINHHVLKQKLLY